MYTPLLREMSFAEFTRTGSAICTRSLSNRDIAFYFKVPIDVSIRRVTVGRAGLKFYEAGMDLGLSDDPVTSFRLFQGKVIDEYDRLTEEFGLTVIDGSGPINEQQERLRDLVCNELTDYAIHHRPMTIPELHRGTTTEVTSSSTP